MDNVYWTSSLNVIYIAGAVDCQIAGASPGGLGSILSQNAWLPVCRGRCHLLAIHRLDRATASSARAGVQALIITSAATCLSRSGIVSSRQCARVAQARAASAGLVGLN